MLATSTTNLENKNSILQLWDINQPSSNTNNGLIEISQVKSQTILNDIAWNHNGTVVASTSQESPIQLTHAKTGKILDNGIVHSQSEISTNLNNITSISFANKSRYLCTSSNSGYLSIYNLKKKCLVRSFQYYDENQNLLPVKQALFDPNSKYMFCISSSPIDDSSLRLYNIRSSDNEYEILSNPKLQHCHATTINYSTLKNTIIGVGSSNNGITLYDISSASDNIINYLCNDGENDSITRINFSSIHKSLLCSSSTNGTIYFNDIYTGKIIQTINPSGKGITSMDLFLDDGVTLACTTSCNELFLYDLRQYHAPLFSTFLDGCGGNGCNPIVKFYSKSLCGSSSHTSSSSIKKQATINDTTANSSVDIQSNQNSSSLMLNTSNYDNDLINIRTTLIVNKTDESFIPTSNDQYDISSPKQDKIVEETNNTSLIENYIDYIENINGADAYYNKDSNSSDKNPNDENDNYNVDQAEENYINDLTETNDSVINNHKALFHDNDHDQDNLVGTNDTIEDAINNNDNYKVHSNDDNQDEIISQEMQESAITKSIQNLHLDMIRQYTNIQIQLEEQNRKLNYVIEENERLKEENEFLKSKWCSKNGHYVGNFFN